MNIKAEHISELIIRFIHGELSANEAAEFETWRQADPAHKALVEELTNENTIAALLKQRYAYDNSRVSARLRDAFPGAQFNNTAEKKPVVFPIVHRVHFLKTAWFRYAAAIIIILGIGAYLWNTQNNSRTITQTKPVPIEKDILPGGQKAMLTLADGRAIILDSAANGQLAVENGSEVIKKDGQVIYGAGQLNNTGVTFNTMSTPKGGQYQLTLADGTKVWLNAASSITYPTVFNGKTREVKVEGEVYFEVAVNKNAPFVVQGGDEEVMVLGTSFNINNYQNEPAAKISLIEGSVKVNDKLLRPGQAYLGGKVILTNIEQDVAWKNGLFNFEGLALPGMMRQLERWYDIRVTFKGDPPPVKISGKMDRGVPLPDLIRFLQEYGLQVTLHDRVLTIEGR